MLKNKKVIIIFLITCFFVFLLPLFSHAAELTPEEKNKVANFAKAFVTEGNKKNILRYTLRIDGEISRNHGYQNRLSSDGYMYFDCASFAAFVYKQTCGVNLPMDSYAYTVRDGFYFDANSNKNFKIVGRYTGDNSWLNPGDLILKTNDEEGHVVVYIGNGEIAHASTDEEVPNVKINALSSWYYEDTYVLRYIGPKPSEGVRGFENYKWPDGSSLNWTEENLSNGNEGGFKHNGLSQGSFGQQTYDLGWIINKLSEILDWIVGLLTYILRVILVGWTSVVESATSWVVELSSNTEASFTIEDLVNNRIPLFDVNFFNFQEAGGEILEQDSVIYILRETIAMWYYVIRNIAIVGLLITLIYIGIRMALSTVGEQKAKYKQLLISWVVSFIITVGIHYIMIIILTINESLIEIIHVSLDGGEASIYDSVRNGAYAIQSSVGWPSLLMYIMLVYLLIKFTAMYFKRFIVVAILTFMAPIIGVTYSIDKIKDNKSQSLSNWLKEYTFNVIIQSVHALLYALMISLAFNVSGKSIFGAIFAAFLIGFILKAEGIFKKIFGIKSGQLKDALKSTAAIMAGGAVVKNFAKSNIKVLKFAAKPVTKPVGKLIEGTKMYRNMDKINQIKNSLDRGDKKIKIGRRTYDVGAITSAGEDFDSREVASELFSKHQSDIEKDKKASKEMLNQAFNSVKGSAQAIVAVPMIFTDSSAGLAMFSKARGSLDKGISKSNEDEKYYTGKGKGIINVLTGGAYRNVANVVGNTKKAKKTMSDSRKGSQYVVAAKLYEKKINKEYDRLYNDADISLDELEEVFEEASRTTSPKTIASTTYKVYATLESITRVRVNDNGKREKETTSLDSQMEQLAQQSKTIEEIQAEVERMARDNKSSRIKIDSDKFSTIMESEVKKLIAAEKGIKPSEVTKKEITKKVKEMTQKEKKKIIQKALVGSSKTKEKEIDEMEKEKTGMGLEKAEEIISIISEKSKGKINQEAYKSNFEKLIIKEVASQLGIEADAVTEADINGYIANMTNKELVQKIKEAGSMEGVARLSAKAKKPEFEKLVRYIQQKKYFEAKKKGKD